jgi:adenylate cyclase
VSAMLPRTGGRMRDVLATFAVAAASFAALFAVFWFFPWITYFLEFKALPLQMESRRPWRPSGNVVIAAIDDRSLKELVTEKWSEGGVWAALEKSLQEYKVSVVGFAMVVPSDLGMHDPILRNLMPRDSATANVDPAEVERNQQAFAEAIADQGSTYLGCALLKDDLEVPLDVSQSDAFVAPDFSALWLHGLPQRKQFSDIPGGPAAPVSYPLSVPGDPSYEHRRYLGPSPILSKAAKGTAYLDYLQNGAATAPVIPMALRVGDELCAPFSIAIVSRYLHGAPLRLTLRPFEISVGDKHLPSDPATQGILAVNFADPADSPPRYSVIDILHKNVPAEALANKIVLVGFTTSAATAIPTYVGSRYLVEVQATFIENILTGEFLRWPRMFKFWSLLIAIWSTVVIAQVLLSTSLSVRRLLVSSFLIVVVCCASYYAVALYYLRTYRIYINWVIPLSGFVVAYSATVVRAAIKKTRERRRLRGAFEHYLDKSIIDTVLNDPAGLEVGGESRHMSVLFADIVEFTGRVERTEPRALVDLLNVYMTAMTEVVLKSGGVVDKLIGDSVMAFWGAPARIANPARSAVECGLQMIAELRRLHAEDKRFQDLEMGVGVATGEVIVGNFGGQRRFDYSVLGDTVNLAARLETLTRQLKVHFLINGETYNEAGAGFVVRNLGLVRVKGKVQPAELYEVVGREGEVADPSFYSRFSEAVKMIRDGHADHAVDVMRELAATKPDPAIQLYLRKLETDGEHHHGDLVLEFDTK